MPKGKLYLQKFVNIQALYQFIGFEVFNRRGRVYIENIKVSKKVETTQIDFTYVNERKNPILLSSCFVQDFMQPICYFPQLDEDLQFKLLHQKSFGMAESLLPKNSVGYFVEGLPAVFNKPLLQLHIDEQGYCHLERTTMRKTPPPPQIILEDEEEEFGV